MKINQFLSILCVGIILFSLSGLTAIGRAETTPTTATLQDNVEKSKPILPAKATERVAALPVPKELLTVDLGGGVTMQFVLIRPGSFTMGSDYRDQKPAHKVTITTPFYLGKFEVTQEQWEKVMGSNPSHFKGAKNPVDYVNWNDCQDFIAKLKEKLPGQAFRLPTEAEWEYACRAGSVGAYSYGDDEGKLGDYAWFDSNSGKTTHPVGEKKPNAWGLYDMHGNVTEWCADWYGEYPTTAVSDPLGPSRRTAGRVFRGGGCYTAWPDCQAGARDRFLQAQGGYEAGLRLALSCSLSGLTAIGRAETTPTTATLQDNVEKSKPILPAKATERVAALPVPKELLTVDLGGGVTMQFVLIRPGSFTMGSVNGLSDEKPPHKVTITKPFYLGKFEVTQEQWEKLMGPSDGNFKGTKNPVNYVSWDDCQDFIAKLKEKLPGQAFRLPTEAEWEYACRAGSTGDFSDGDNAGVLGEYAWFYRNAGETTHPVGEKKPNAWGFYDMHGNVSEWCADWYDGGYYSATTESDPLGPSRSGANRVMRGGSWRCDVSFCRKASRRSNIPSVGNDDFGLRLALSLVP